MLRPAIVFAAVLVARPVRADPAAPGAQPVNLLKTTASTVAVSSTVANRAILPAHLVDGDLATAWNSRTGELEGAWIGARVPADAHVTAIRMTVGFTKVDKKLGDLFTMNPRIRKVRVLRDGVRISDQTLDPALRTLQDIRVDGPGGELKIEVVEIVPGTKKSWREISVSELEVWGTLATGIVARRGKPVVRIGSFDPPPPISKAECVKALFPQAKGNRISSDADAEVISSTDVVAVSEDLVVCRIEHAGPEVTDDPYAGTPIGGTQVKHTSTTVELAPVTRKPRLVAGPRISSTIIAGTRLDSAGGGNDGSVILTPFPITTSETALLVDVSDHMYGPMIDTGTTQSTLYRVEASGLTEILSFKSTWNNGESNDADQCKLTPPAVLRSKPQSLELACTHVEGRWHHEDPRGDGEFTKESTTRYRWTGAAYAQP